MPGVREALDGTALVRWGHLCLDGLERHRDEINALNVFPVPDADTGTNLLSTMRTAVAAGEAVLDAGYGGVSVGDAASTTPVGDAVPSVPVGDAVPAVSVGAVAGAMARAATVGARGNSGIILSQVLRGFGDAAVGDSFAADELRNALRRAGILVREALSDPIEGTMLTVLDAAAERAAECAADATLGEVATAAAGGAAKALGETPSQLDVLRTAGVVDAGARGLLVLLDALVAVTTGQQVERQRYTAGFRAPGGRFGAGTSSRESSGGEPGAAAGGVGGPVAVGAGGPVTANSVRPEADRSGSSGVGSGDRSAGGISDSGGTGRCSIGSGDRADGAASRESAIGGDGRGTGDALRELGIPRDNAGPEHAVPGDASGVGGSAPHYEVMYVLSGTDEERIAGLRRELARLGDSVVVVGDGSGTWSAHVHTADAGAAVEAGLSAGTLRDIRIEGLESGAVAADSTDRGILTVAFGPGAAQLFEDAGAVVLDGGVTADALLTAILAMPHREVLVLANGALPAHELVTVSVAARGTDPAQPRREVLMLPSGAMVQGLAALSVHDAQRTAVDDVFAMSEAAAGTRWGAVRVAAERALTIVGTCARGDGLGLVGHDVVVIDPDVRAAARTLLDRMLGLGGELVTLLVGVDSPAGLGDELSEHITATFPGVEVVVYDGGQPVDLIQIGVE
ncbi:DAK2 domain-containing protein [Nocardia sp. BMG111209]|uniref:DAK2 domain-containing protein n=1 Tax=Nocardia sp. BMG111209 TaxID=1160137 RepID=UPI000380A60A|nr:DAK2 domain-containing protein [Nocardia sp. BMG111209]